MEGDDVQRRLTWGRSCRFHPAFVRSVHNFTQGGRFKPPFFFIDHLCLADRCVFFPLAAALKSKIVRKVGLFDIPPHARQLPLFRSGVIDPQTGWIENWWLWDGENTRMVGSISQEQRKLPIKSIWNDTLLIERIEQGWSPEKDGR